MDLSELLRQHPGITEGAPADNSEILAMYGQAAMKAGVDLLYDRSPDFFQLLRYRGEQNMVLLQRSPERLEGTAVLSLRPGYVGGEERTVGYFSDLRFRHPKTMVKHWRSLVTAVMNHAPCQDFYLCIMDGNLAARRSLENLDGNGGGFRRFLGYSMVNVLGRFPLLRPKLAEGLTVEQVKADARDELIRFLDREHRRLPFGEVASVSLPWRLREWAGFKLEDFVVVRREGEIIACAAPYDPSHVKRNVIRAWPWTMKLANMVLGLLAPVLKTRRISLGGPLKVLYLTHLCFEHTLPKVDKVAALQGILGQVFLRHPQECFHMLSFCDFEGQDLHRGLKGYLLQTEKMGLYSSHSGTALPTHAPDAAGFEMSLV